MADNEQIRQQNEINRATGQGHDAAKRETAGMVEKLREALRWALGALQDCARYRRDGRQFCCFCNTATESPDGFQCPKSCPYQQAHRTLAESEAGVDTFVLPAHETILTSTGAEQVRPTSFVPTECPIPPTTPEEVNDILASVGLPPRPLPPPEIARRIVAPWTVYGNVRIDGKVIECAIIAVIEEERKAASEAKLSVVRYAGKRIAELEDQEKQYEARLEETAHSVSVWQRSFEDAGKRIAELKAALKKSEDSQREYFELNEGLQDDLKLQRQANKFGDDQHKQEVETLKRQLDFLRGLC